MMPREAREEEVYEDLSMMLQLIKKKLALLIRTPNHLHSDHFQSYEEQQSNNLLAGFKLKYTNLTNLSPLIQKVIERFFCRIKEMVNQLLPKIPRHKHHLARILKEIEQFTVRPLHDYNHLAIISFLDLVTAIKLGKEPMHRTEINTSHEKQAEKHSVAKNNDTQHRSLLAEGCIRRLSEVQMIEKSAQPYLVMGIDAEHLRARYFDIKNEKGSVESDMIFRNRFIRQIINDFELEYRRFKRKDNGQAKRLFCRFRKRHDGWEGRQSFSHSEQHLETLDSAQFSRTPRIIKNGTVIQKHKKETPSSSFAIDRKNRDNKMTIETFRSLFEEKLNEKKENIKIKNVIMSINGSEGRLKAIRPNNEKRLEFYKKSQDQIRLRYKYYNYNNKSTIVSKSSIKYRTINPESTFNTIDS